MALEGRAGMLNTLIAFFMSLGVVPIVAQDRALLGVKRSEVSFLSEAPLERISATNERSSGLLDPVKRTFGVQIPIMEFQGFNSPLQREHFNENYMDSRSWPNATFQGRIIETVDLTTPGDHQVRAKGMFSVRGIEQERIVVCRVVVSEAGVRVTSEFMVALEDHGIRIPRVVQQKLASNVSVKVDLRYEPLTVAP